MPPPPPNPQHRGAADAAAAEQQVRVRVEGRRAKMVSGSSSGGVSPMQHRAKETAPAGTGVLFGEDTTPQKPLKVGVVSSGVGALHKSSVVGKEKTRNPSRLPNRMPGTTIAPPRADGEKHRAKDKAIVSSGASSTLQKHRAKQTGLVHGDEKAPEGTSGEVLQRQRRAKQETGPSQLRWRPPGVRVQGARDKATERVTTRDKHSKGSRSLPWSSSPHAADQQLRTSSQRLSGKTGYSLDGKTCRSLDGKSIAQDCKESAANKNTIVRVTEDNDLQEANDLIRKLNELGLGEDISSKEFVKYFNQLPDRAVVNTFTKLNIEKLTPLYARHARYRIRYYKMLKEESKLNAELKENYDMDLLETEDFSEELLVKMGYFVHFEKNGILGWSFHPDRCRLEDLDDYQRLVPDNHGCSEYTDWDLYQKYFYSYETDLEYLDYCKELSKELKWMEDYVLIKASSLKRAKIRTRGARQAIKIATGFSKITGELAYTGYHECVDNLCFDVFWLKDLDGVYFEVWLRVTKQASFRYALEEVYKLNKFPSRQKRMKYALDNDCSDMEMEFHTCTKNVTSEVTEDKARELIAEAVKKMERPKFYGHYIRKKLTIAQAIGLIPMVRQVSAESG